MEVRARLEAQAKKKKRGFMTPERKKRLRVCLFHVLLSYSALSPLLSSSPLSYLLLPAATFRCRKQHDLENVATAAVIIAHRPISSRLQTQPHVPASQLK